MMRAGPAGRSGSTRPLRPAACRRSPKGLRPAARRAPSGPAHLDALERLAGARHDEDAAGGARAQVAGEKRRRVQRRQQPAKLPRRARVVQQLVAAHGVRRAKHLRGRPRRRVEEEGGAGFGGLGDARRGAGAAACGPASVAVHGEARQGCRPEPRSCA
jgi:hypothetical protein